MCCKILIFFSLFLSDGLVSTSPAFVRWRASHLVGPHGRLAQKNGKSDPYCWGRMGSTKFALQFVAAVTAPPLVGCVVCSHCDDIFMCVVNKQFELLEFVIDSVYVDLQHDEISLTFTAGVVSLSCVCSNVVVFGEWSVCEVVVGPYVDVVVAVTVMRVLLFVLHVCMMREFESARVTAMLVCGDGGGMVVVSAGHVGGTRGSGTVSSAADVLGMIVVRGMRGVGGVVRCVCVWLGAAWEERCVSG